MGAAACRHFPSEGIVSLRVLVCGGREFDDQSLVDAVLDALFAQCNGSMMVMHGSASGADACAHAWAFAKRAVGAQVGVSWWAADWKRHGRAAGPIRNQTMLDEGRPQLVVAFPGGRGTADMVAKSRASGLHLIEVPSKADAQQIVALTQAIRSASERREVARV